MITQDENNNMPNYKDIAKAVGYWVIMNDLKEFFQKANMPVVHEHLSAACTEIDRIWQEYESNQSGID